MKNSFHQKIISFLAVTFVSIFGFCENSNLICTRDSTIIIPVDQINSRSEKSDFCYSLKPWILMSMNCYKGKCKALEYFDLNDRPTSSFGTPGSALCKKAGGLVQTIFFESTSGSQKFNRCLFSQDTSFVDLGTFWSNQTKIDIRSPDSIYTSLKEKVHTNKKNK